MTKLLIGFALGWLLFSGSMFDQSRNFTWMHEPLAKWNDELSKALHYKNTCANTDECAKAEKYLTMMVHHGERWNNMLGDKLSFNSCVLREAPMQCRL